MKDWKQNLKTQAEVLTLEDPKKLKNLTREQWEQKFKGQWILATARQDHGQAFEMFRLRCDVETPGHQKTDAQLLLEYQQLLMKLKLLKEPALSSRTLAPTVIARSTEPRQKSE